MNIIHYDKLERRTNGVSQRECAKRITVSNDLLFEIIFFTLLLYIQVDMTNRTMDIDLSNYVENGEWELLSITIQRNVVYYACCKV